MEVDAQRKSRKSKFTDVFDDNNNKENEVNSEDRKRRKRFSYKEKSQILNELKLKSKEEIREKYNISERALRMWVSEKEIIEEAAKNSKLNKYKKKSYNHEMDDCLFDWLLKTQQSGIPVSGPMLKNQALIVNKNLQKLPKFVASEDCLSGWKVRKNIRCLKITGNE